jgi:hypothetical protein
LLDAEMLDTVSPQQFDIGATCTCKCDAVAKTGLFARDVDGNVHDAVAYFVAVICKVQNFHGFCGDGIAGRRSRNLVDPRFTAKWLCCGAYLFRNGIGTTVGAH